MFNCCIVLFQSDWVGFGVLYNMLPWSDIDAFSSGCFEIVQKLIPITDLWCPLVC